MATLANLVVKLTMDAGAFSSGVEAASSKLQNFGSQISSTGQSMTAGITLPIVGAGAAALLMGNQFNAGMANVISLVPSAADEIGGLRGDVQGLAVEMGQSTGDMTDGLYQVVSAFGYSAESMDLLRLSATAGAAGLASTTDAINLISAVTKGYGDTSIEAAQQASDLAFVTVQLGQTSFPELAASIGRVTPLAASLGVAQEELFATMATATGVTGGAAEVSTQLRGVLQSLMAPTADMTTLMTDMGYANGSAMLEGLGLQGTMQAILGAAEASGTPLQKFIGSIEGQTLAMALGGPLADDYKTKLDAMGNAAGATDAAFAAQTEGVNAAGFAMQQAAIKAQVISENLGNALGPAVLAIMPYFEQFVSWVQQMIDRFMALDPQTQMIVFGVLGLVAAIGPLLMILGPMVTGLGVLVGVMGALMSPILLVVAGVALLAMAVVQHFGGIQQTIAAASAFVQSIMQGLSDFIGTNQAQITGWIETAWTQIQSIVTNMVNGVQAVVTAVLGVVGGFINTHGAEIQAFILAAWEQIGRIINLALELINTVVTAVLAGVAQFLNQHGAEIQAILGAAWTMISSLIETVLSLIEGIIRVALAIIRGDWEQAWTEVRTLVENLWTSIQTFIEGALTFVISLVTLFVNTVIEWFTNLYQRLVGGSIVPDMVNAIIGFFTTMWERLNEIVGELVSAVTTFFSNLRSNVETTVSNLRSNVETAWSNLRSNVETAVSNLRSNVETAWSNLRSNVETTVSNLRSNLETAWSNLRTTVETTVSNLRTTVETAWSNLRTNVETTVSNLRTTVETKITDLRDNVLKFVTELRDRMRRMITDIVEYWIMKAILLRNTVQSTISDMRDRILNIVGGLVGGMASAGANMVQAFADGVIGALNSAIDAARELVQRLRDLLPGSDAKTGPLSDLTAAGRALPETMAMAIGKGAPSALSAVDSLAGGLYDLLALDTTKLGAEAGLNWIEALIDGIRSRLPDLGSAMNDVTTMMRPQMQAAPASATSGGASGRAGGGMNVTLNISMTSGDPVQVRQAASLGVTEAARALGLA